MRIKFIKNLGIREGQGAGPHYRVGEEHDFVGQIGEGYAHAYIQRGYAVEAPVASAPLAELAIAPPPVDPFVKVKGGKPKA